MFKLWVNQVICPNKYVFYKRSTNWVLHITLSCPNSFLFFQFKPDERTVGKVLLSGLNRKRKKKNSRKCIKLISASWFPKYLVLLFTLFCVWSPIFTLLFLAKSKRKRKKRKVSVKNNRQLDPWRWKIWGLVSNI